MEQIGREGFDGFVISLSDDEKEQQRQALMSRNFQEPNNMWKKSQAKNILQNDQGWEQLLDYMFVRCVHTNWETTQDITEITSVTILTSIINQFQLHGFILCCLVLVPDHGDYATGKNCLSY